MHLHIAVKYTESMLTGLDGICINLEFRSRTNSMEQVRYVPKAEVNQGISNDRYWES